MSWLRRLLQPFTKPTEVKNSGSGSVRHAWQAMAVEFDPSNVSKSVKANLRRNIELLDDLEKKRVKQAYKEALRSVLAGGDEHVLYTALMKIEGMTERRAVEIARSLNAKATEQINREHTLSLGITHAVWMYAHAPCIVDPRYPTEAEIRQDAAHKAADGKKYEIRIGLFVDGKWTLKNEEFSFKVSDAKLRKEITESGQQAWYDAFVKEFGRFFAKSKPHDLTQNAFFQGYSAGYRMSKRRKEDAAE